jgi:hypothetical protein
VSVTNEQVAELDRRERVAVAIFDEMKRMSEQETQRVYGEHGEVVAGRYSREYVTRWHALTKQLLAAQEAILDYRRSL